MDIQAQLQSALRLQSLPVPSQAWLHTLLSSRNHPPPPLNSLAATARARLLAADLTTPGILDDSYVASSSFSPGITNADVKDAKLARDVVVQVLDIENLNRSRWEQVEELEAIERGEQTRGREIIRLPPGSAGEDENEHDEGSSAASADDGGTQAGQQRGGPGAGAGGQGQRSTGPKNATHKLVLQDCKGQKVFGVELRRIERIGVGKTLIGEKMLLKGGSTVARGVVLLEPTSCIILGGKVEAWQKAWVEGRLARLREIAGANRREQ